MSELTEFLLARIAEDEAMARAATSGPWSNRRGPAEMVMAGDVVVARTYADGHAARDDRRHIARHDPARVLARCEADRQIVGLHGDDEPNCMGGYVEGITHRRVIESEFLNGVPTGYCDTLRALALPYADHSDYRQEWKP